MSTLTRKLLLLGCSAIAMMAGRSWVMTQQQGQPAQQQGQPAQQQGQPAQQQGHPAQQQGHPAQQQGYRNFSQLMLTQS
jgi:hypothetical protein